MNYQEVLDEIYKEVLPFINEGKQADYIPALANINPDQIGMCLQTLDGEQYLVGDVEPRFSIQSISKVFSLAMALGVQGDKLWSRMGKEPSGTAFNSLIQLEIEKGKPRNPFINSGAIVMADILLSHFGCSKGNIDSALHNFLSFVHSISGCDTIDYNNEVAISERDNSYLNAAIVNLLRYHKNINNDIEDVLRFYFMTCSIEMNCKELSSAFVKFANHKKTFSYNGIVLTSSQVKRINAIMQTCGFYDEAGEFSYLVGLPGKSGVGGGIVAIYPQRYAVTVWSPRLNEKGNSVVGIKALELLTTRTKESIF